MPTQNTHFFSGQADKRQIPLQRYLPPYQKSVLPKMIKDYGITSGWILDPLCSQPLAVLDLAQAGYTVFAASINPIMSLMLEVFSAAPPKSEWLAALSEFGSLRVREDRLESYLQKAFFASCPRCEKRTNWVSYIWEKETIQPKQKLIQCPTCNTESLINVQEKDLQALKMIGNPFLHRSRAAQRVISDPELFSTTSELLQEAYNPRSLSTVVTLFNRLEALKTSPIRRKIVELLLVIAFDYGTNLWPNNQFSTRPRQVITPKEYIEHNVWQKMEAAVESLGGSFAPIPLTHYPELPPNTGGICLYPQRFRERELQFTPAFKAAVVVLPRPNQALWALNAIWSGWLWGDQSDAKIRASLTRKRYDWYWLVNAMQKRFAQSQQNIPWFGLAPELTPGYSVSYLAAAAANGFRLNRYAYAHEERTAQFYWDKSYSPVAIGSPPTQDEMLSEYIESKGDTANYQELFTYYIIRANKENLILNSGIIPDINLFTNVQKRFENNLQDTRKLTKIDQDSLEHGDFWLTNPPKAFIPLVDKIEEFFIESINHNQVFDLESIKTEIDRKLPCYLPSSKDWLITLIDSYCEKIYESQQWKIKVHEQASARAKDLLELWQSIRKLGERFGFFVTTEENQITWEEKADGKQHYFYLCANSVFSPFLPKINEHPSSSHTIIYPGSRAHLLTEKHKKNMLYTQAFDKTTFIKFRLIRKLANDPNITYRDWLEQIQSDPAESGEYTQLSMF